MSNEAKNIQMLESVRKVVGFANLGVMAGPNNVRSVSTYLEDLKATYGADAFPESEKALESMKFNILPNQALCISAMKGLTELLRPLRETVRAAQALPSALSFERQR